VIFFKLFLSLDQISELYDATWRKLLAPAVSSGATGLPLKPRRQGCKVVKTQGLAESSCLGVE
jgi:hypothetical protein